MSDGLATTKSDVYAFGVVLFEIISGREAIIRTEGMVMKNPERRSLVSIVSSFRTMIKDPYIKFPLFFLRVQFRSLCETMQMLAALRNSPDSMSMSSMKDYIDPNMMDLYPHDCLFKVKDYYCFILFVIT